jgi:general secretion pathway protein D
MRLIKVFLLVILFNGLLFSSDEKININFKNLKIMDLVKITSKIIDKNILITQQIKGNVDFISNKPVNKSELTKILIYVLESKGYTLINNQDILRIVKLNESVKSNVPVITSNKKQDYYQMVTEVFKVHNTNVDFITSKVRHLISKNAKIVSNKDSNTIVLTDFQGNIATVRKIINLMTNGARKSMIVVKLKNIQATDAKKNLDAITKSMFNQKIETEKVSVVSNKENNSLVLIGNSSNTNYLKKYITKLDLNGSLIKRVVEVYALKNVEAKNVIKIIDGIIGKKKYLDAKSKPLSAVDEESNSIVLMGPSDEVEYIKVILNELDKEKAQVYVQARIIEVNDELVDEIGIKYGIFGGKSGTKGLGTFASSLNGGDSVISFPKGLSLDIPKLSSGLALGASISLLDKDGALDIVSEPSILAINNKESSIYVGETISVKTSSSVSDGGTKNENFNREDVGLTLTVKPRISNDNKVTLEINAVLEDVKTTDTNSGNADTRKKEVKTTAIVNNGEAVILGGLIENKEEITENKIPLLGDIPVFGKLFNHSKTNIRKRSLVIIVTPYIIPKSKDLTYVRNQLAQLKILEDKYLRDSLLRLRQKQIKKHSDEIEYKNRLKALEEKLSRMKSSNTINLDIDKNSDELTNEQKHKQRLKEYFGQ